MNEPTLLRLKVIVERAVRPVRIGLARKVRIREEMLNHVVSVFEDEFAECSNEEKSVLQTQARFGAPEAIARQLQAGVPKVHLIFGCHEQLFRGASGENFSRVVGRYSLWIFFSMFIIQSLAALDSLDVRLNPYPPLCFAALFDGMIVFAFFVVLILMDAAQKALKQRSFWSTGSVAVLTSIASFVPIAIFELASASLLPRDEFVWAHWDVSVFVFLALSMSALTGCIAWMKSNYDAICRKADEWEELQIE